MLSFITTIITITAAISTVVFDILLASLSLHQRSVFLVAARLTQPFGNIL